MENGSVKKREMMDAEKQNFNPWWPVVAIFSTILILPLVLFQSLKRFFISLCKEKKSLNKKIILVTGAGRGLGRRLAMDLAKLGAHIACVDINKKNNDETAELIRKDGGIAESFTCNIAKVKQIEQMKKDVTSKMGTVSIVINNAALVMAMTLKSIRYEDIRAIYEVNLMGPVCVTKAFLEDMMERNEGHIVTISSMGSYVCAPSLSIYNSSKAGLSRFLDCATVELNTNENNQIKITTVHPFIINTSNDYMNWYESIFPAMEMDYVSRKVIDAIQYEKDSITIPSFIGFIKVIDALFGTFQYNSALRIIKHKINLPDTEEVQTLPYSTIVAETVTAQG